MSGHDLRLEKICFNLKGKKGFFTVEAPRVWNSLLNTVVSAPSLAKFKKRLDA